MDIKSTARYYFTPSLWVAIGAVAAADDDDDVVVVVLLCSSSPSASTGSNFSLKTGEESLICSPCSLRKSRYLSRVMQASGLKNMT